MAQLVYLKNRPQKHHALKQAQMLIPNKAISEIKQYQIAQSKIIFNDFIEQRSSLIKSYLYHRGILEQQARTLARKSTTRHALLNIMMILYRWHKSIETEANAMLLLAQKVAVSVLNCHTLNTELIIEKSTIMKQLADYFSITIISPEPLTPMLETLILNLEHYFAQLTFLTVDQHDKGLHMKIEWHGETRIFDLHNVDLGWALKRATKNIMRFENLENKA